MGATSRVSADRSSSARKRALRALAREEHGTYQEIYDRLRAAVPDRYVARGRAWTQLRQEYPERYLELFAQEQALPGSSHDSGEIPAGIRSKSWQRALARLAEFRATEYRKLLAQFQAEGMSNAQAYARAVTVLRTASEDFFVQLLTEEYRLWLLVSDG